MADKRYNCPCCGKTVFKEEHLFEICPNCGWEDDLVQFRNPDFEGGANFFSLNKYKTLFLAGKNAKQLQDSAKKKWNLKSEESN